MEPKLIQRQSQKLLLSPQIRQYLKLLELPLIELVQRLDTELAENPLLEEQTAGASQGEEEREIRSDENAKSSLLEHSKELKFGDSFDSFDDLDDNFRESFDYPDVGKSDPKELQKRKDFRESLLTEREALSDFLLWQIRFLDLAGNDRKIAEEIIGNIDDNGYLRVSVEEIAQACQSSPADVSRILEQIQELDPPGIGARTLQEALLLQLKKKKSDPAASLASEMVDKHFDLLRRKDWPQFAKIMSTDIKSVQKAGQLISRLEPRPGRTFYAEEPTVITPDATVAWDESDDGKLKIEIHDEVIPELRINPYYRHMLRRKDLDDKTRAFLQEKMANAVNFIKALRLRKSTLREITEELIRVQRDFFEKGFSELRPLRLKDIAQTLGIHESTVSRALQGKYISTPQGTIPYKSFFSAKLENLNGEGESQKSIMEKVRALIAAENPRMPLSDQEIVRRLQSEGLVIARRTVAKYRDLLKILPSHLRRQH